MRPFLRFAVIALAALFFVSGSPAANAKEGLYGFERSIDGRQLKRRNSRSYRSNYVGRRARRRRSYIRRGARRVQKRRAQKRHYQKRRSKRLARKRAKTQKPRVSVNPRDPVQLVVSLPQQRVYVYKGLSRIASARISTGRPGRRTPAGIFSIIQKQRIHYSNLYGAAPMPYMQRITWSGVALHAGNVSRPYASHGCIRLPYGFAKSLFRKTSMGAHVIVASSGASSPRPIEHETLLQPMPGADRTENVGSATSASLTSRPQVVIEAVKGDEGVRTASLAADGVQSDLQSGASEKGDASAKSPTEAELVDIPGFIPPVEAAVIALDKSKEELAMAKSMISPAEQKLVEAKELVVRRRDALKRADGIVASKNQDVRDAYKVVRQQQVILDKINRKLRKAERGVVWSKRTIDKRRDNPRFEGNWMRRALERLEERKALVASIEAEASPVQEELDKAKADHQASKLQLRKAVELAEIRRNKLSKARAGEVARLADVRKSKAGVKTAKLQVKRATVRLRASQARVKMPLRILITPHRGLARVKNTQRLLNELGYKVGPADGVIGKATREAIKKFQAEMQRKQTGLVSKQLLTDLYHRAGKEQVANAHMYVRQGFLDLFDVPVEVDTPERPLGTHVFTARYFDDKATQAKWTALTVKERIRYKSKKGKTKKGGYIRVSAREALDRVRIPGYARRHLAQMLTPGTSIIISDKGISRETGRGTDFVILTH